GTSSLSFYIGMAVAGVLILFFAAPDKNIFVSFAKGVYSIYEMATGVVGDLISYVRLFAIGLAGAIIAQVFNELAVGLSGNIPVLSWILMAVILIIGHGLNIFISSLGAFVHPVRLTFVEFYKNAEFDGGGRSFDPFRRKKINN
ncbi:MAG: V-type ATPase 116kDa subunit family protein, partial [Mucinivorans sp.]